MTTVIALMTYALFAATWEGLCFALLADAPAIYVLATVPSWPYMLLACVLFPRSIRDRS